MRKRQDSKNEFKFSMEEVRCAIVLAGTLDPTVFESAESRALIYKAKSLAATVEGGEMAKISIL